MPMPAPRRAVALAALLAFTLLAACGGGDDDVGAGPSTTRPPGNEAFAAADVKVVAEDIDFPQDEFTAPAGEITIGYRNDGRILHTLVLEGVEEFEKLSVRENDDVAVGTVTLEPAAYTLFCDVPGHRAAGMEATLTVE